MAADIPYPPGFYGEIPLPTLHLFNHNDNPTQEMNYNDYVYFYSDTGHLTSRVIPADILRAIIAKPVERQGMLDKLMMVNDVGDIAPAHFPNISDVTRCDDVQAVIHELGKEEVEYGGTTPLIPKKLVDKIDPKPKFRRSGPIYSIGHQFSCDFGSYTDDIMYFQVRSPMTCLTFTVVRDQFMDEDPSSRYNIVKLLSEKEDGQSTLKYGASVVMWNGRRITRPSFKPHFRKVVATHSPALIIVTEVGAQKTNCTRIIESLGTTMRWTLAPGLGLHGGSAVFWDPTRFAGVVHVSKSDIPLRVLGTMRALGR